MIINPVITKVPYCITTFHRKKRVDFMRLLARRAVLMSSKISGFVIKKLSKDALGVPQRCEGVYWSLTHKEKYVAGVVSMTPIGVDIEEILSIPGGLFNKIATSFEWELSSADRKQLFFRYWTAKEAVLKAECVGLVGLSNCNISKVISTTSMFVVYNRKEWAVEHFYFDNHVAAIAVNDSRISWLV